MRKSLVNLLKWFELMCWYAGSIFYPVFKPCTLLIMFAGLTNVGFQLKS